MFSVQQASTGEGKFALSAVIARNPEGVTVCLGGGEKPHIGSVVLCQPRPSLKQDGSMSFTTSVLNIVGHKDEDIARPLAETLCSALQKTVVVTGGIHIEMASPEEIVRLQQAAVELTGKILALLQDER